MFNIRCVGNPTCDSKWFLQLNTSWGLNYSQFQLRQWRNLKHKYESHTKAIISLLLKHVLLRSAVLSEFDPYHQTLTSRQDPSFPLRHDFAVQWYNKISRALYTNTTTTGFFKDLSAQHIDAYTFFLFLLLGNRHTSHLRAVDSLELHIIVQ